MIANGDQAATIARGLFIRRAAVSLAELRRDQARRAEALDLLAPIYGGFTEGLRRTRA
jgi:hypothetical protein